MSAAPYTVGLDQSAALRLAQCGAALLILDLPERSVITIDQQRYAVGPRFQGVKMLPPGPHFVGYSAVSKHGEVAPVTWFLFHAAVGQVVVRRWDPAVELLLPLLDEDEANRFSHGVRQFDFDSGLAPYNLQAYQNWQSLSSCITPTVIQRLAPAGLGQSSIVVEEDHLASAAKTAAEQRLEQQLHEHQFVFTGSHLAHQRGAAEQAGEDTSSRALVGRVQYSPVPSLVKESGITAEELTALNLDKSPVLEKLLASSSQTDDLIGELQYAFIAFLMGQSLEGFLQWKAILLLLFGSIAAVASHAELYRTFLQALHAQLLFALHSSSEPANMPGSESISVSPLLIEGLTENHFLQPLLASFREGHSEGLPSAVQGELDKVTHLLAATASQHPDHSAPSDDEYAPVVVDFEA